MAGGQPGTAVKFVIVAAIEGVVGAIAWLAVQATLDPASSWRDPVLAILPILVIVVGGAMFIAWVRAPNPMPAPAAEVPSKKARKEIADWRRAADMAITWLYRRQNWEGLSPDGQSREPAPKAIWADRLYRELGLGRYEYEPPAAVIAEPGFEPPLSRDLSQALMSAYVSVVEPRQPPARTTGEASRRDTHDASPEGLRAATPDASLSVDEAAVEHEDVPESWTGGHWRGKLVLRCPWDAFHTVDQAKADAHRETHTEPPSEAEHKQWHDAPQPWARTALHFVGDGNHYYPGVPTDPDLTIYAPPAYAEEILKTGLYLEGPAPLPRPPGLAGIPVQMRPAKLNEYRTELQSLISRGQKFENELWALDAAHFSRSSAESEGRSPWQQWEDQVGAFRTQWWRGDESLERAMEAGDTTLPTIGPPWRVELARRYRGGVRWLREHAVEEAPIGAEGAS